MRLFWFIFEVTKLYLIRPTHFLWIRPVLCPDAKAKGNKSSLLILVCTCINSISLTKLFSGNSPANFILDIPFIYMRLACFSAVCCCECYTMMLLPSLRARALRMFCMSLYSPISLSMFSGCSAADDMACCNSLSRCST